MKYEHVPKRTVDQIRKACNHRISQNGAVTYSFDADGNLQSSSDGKTYSHNKDNRLVQYSDGSTSTTASYQHDPFGRRISKTVDGATTYFLWDGSQLLAEYDDSGIRQKHYSYLASQPLAVAQWQETPIVIPQEIIMDNDEAGTTSTGTWTSTNSNKAYNGNYRLSNNLGNTYRWTPSGLKNATYDVYARWPGVKQHNTAAQYSIAHDGQSDTSTQDQSKTGNQWVLLGSYTFTGSGSEYIELSDSGGKTAADAIQLVEQTPPPPPPPPTQEVIIDNDAPETSSTGTWTSTNSNKAYNGSYRLSNNLGNTYRWTPTGLNASTYDVYARWPGVKQHNESAQYTIAHDGQTDTSIQNQSQTGNQWVLLGSYTFTGSGSEYIELSDSGGKTAADAIRLVEQAGSSGPTYGEVWYAIHTDHLGTPQFITDLNQQISWSQSHSAFGEATVDEDPDGDGTNLVYNQRFPGQYYDQESGLHYNFFRVYDPQTGRYITSDPIGLGGGINSYIYANANSLKYLDLSGLKWGKSDFWGHYNNGGGSVTLSGIGLLQDFRNSSSVTASVDATFLYYKSALKKKLLEQCKGCKHGTVTASLNAHEFDGEYDVTNASDALFSIGNGQLFNQGACSGKLNCKSGRWSGRCGLHFYVRDRFEDPYDVYDLIPWDIETGTPYRIRGDWNQSRSWSE